MLSRRQAHLSVVPINRTDHEVFADLTFSEFSEAVAAVGAGRWVTELIVEPNRDRGIVVMPASGDDKDGSTLAVWADAGSYRVDQLRWDIYLTVSYWPTIEEALVEVKCRMRAETPPYLN